jgi:hypothetical protein
MRARRSGGASGQSQASLASTPKPRPSRAGLEKADKRLEEAEAIRAKEKRAFENESAALRKREEAARRAFDAKRRKLVAARQEQVDSYDAALKTWRAS